MIVHTMNGNVAAAPLLDTFWSTSWSSNYAYYISFQSSRSQESNASNGMQLGVETKELWSFEDEPRKAKVGISQPRPHFEGCFAAVKPLFGTQVPLRSTRTPISQLQNGLWKFPSSAKSTPLRKCSKLKKWAAKFSFCYQMISKLQNGYKMIFKLQNGYENAPGIKMGCEIPIWLRNVFAVP